MDEEVMEKVREMFNVEIDKIEEEWEKKFKELEEKLIKIEKELDEQKKDIERKRIWKLVIDKEKEEKRDNVIKGLCVEKRLSNEWWIGLLKITWT